MGDLRHPLPRHVRITGGSVDPEAAPGALAALAAFLDASVQQLGEETLHHATHLGTPVHGLREQAAVAADDEAVAGRFDLGERAEVREQRSSGLDALRETAAQTRLLRREAPPDALHE